MESTCTAAEWSCSGTSGTCGGALEAALEQDEATSWHGQDCLAVQRGYVAEERVPRRHGCADEAVLRALEVRLAAA